MLSEVNKVYKNNSIFAYFLLYFVPTPPLILTSPFINFSKSLKPPPVYFDPPVYYEPESILLNDRGVRRSDFLGSEILATNDYFGSMKDAGIFLGREKRIACPAAAQAKKGLSLRDF